MRGPHKFANQTGLEDSTLIVGWGGDAGKIGESITDYLINRLEGHFYYEIDVEDFFPLSGVSIEDDLVSFPESKFYICPSYNLVIFKSDPPSFELFDFFNKVLDIAQRFCKTKVVYTLGGMVTLSPHTVPRRLMGTFSNYEIKESLSNYDIESDSDYETPPGQKPTLNSFLLWTAKRRNLDGIALWIPVPFYLMSVVDPKAEKKVLEFINNKFGYELNLDEFDEAIKRQNRKINEARDLYPELDTYLLRLEGNITLSEEENMKIVKQIEEYLKSDP